MGTTNHASNFYKKELSRLLKPVRAASRAPRFNRFCAKASTGGFTKAEAKYSRAGEFYKKY